MLACFLSQQSESVDQVEQTNVLINGSRFEDCYASFKGGGVHLRDGNTSVTHSSFVNNTAGSDNVDSSKKRGIISVRVMKAGGSKDVIPATVLLLILQMLLCG